MLVIRKSLPAALAVVVGACLGAIRAFADSTAVNITTNESTKSAVSTTTWYASPWLWAVAGGVFLIIVIALTTRGRSNS